MIIVLKENPTLKYLGVTLDECLTWKCHISDLRQKLAKVCGIIYKLRHCAPFINFKNY